MDTSYTVDLQSLWNARGTGEYVFVAPCSEWSSYVLLSADIVYPDFPKLTWDMTMFASASVLLEAGRGRGDGPKSCAIWQGTLHTLLFNTARSTKTTGHNTYLYLSVRWHDEQDPWWADLGGLDLCGATAMIHMRKP